ncbi:MAG: 7,8-dihydroneopterin aldolase/epimerase/oxygenase [Acidimicrobiaceae bacterium]|nr:7,8-dihydroneopterin aldolase/epimerase/oxygenase [Acidimicrobiaceae bacterium]
MLHIQLHGLRAMGTHGVLAEEQSRAQPFEVDLDVEFDSAAAAETDALEDTVDYGELAAAVERVITAERHQLLERLAGRICETAMSDPRVSAVTATVRKLRPPVPVDLDSAAVRLRVTRAAAER